MNACELDQIPGWQLFAGVVAEYLDIMSTHFARQKRGRLKLMDGPDEGGVTGEGIKSQVDYCSHVLRGINYMISQTAHKKIVEQAIDKFLMRPTDAG